MDHNTYTDELDILFNILEIYAYPRETIICIYLSGSRLYGNLTLQSDKDYTLIVKCYSGNQNITHNTIDISLISSFDMDKYLFEHNLQRLINIFTPKNYILFGNFEYEFKLDTNLLRRSVSEISNKCFHHAKVSWRDKDYYKAKKHLIHSIRYVEFGIQIMVNNKIINFAVCNDISTKIMKEESLDWNFYVNTYGKIGKTLYKEQFLKLVCL